MGLTHISKYLIQRAPGSAVFIMDGFILLLSKKKKKTLVVVSLWKREHAGGSLAVVKQTCCEPTWITFLPFSVSCFYFKMVMLHETTFFWKVLRETRQQYNQLSWRPIWVFHRDDFMLPIQLTYSVFMNSLLFGSTSTASP